MNYLLTKSTGLLFVLLLLANGGLLGQVQIESFVEQVTEVLDSEEKTFKQFFGGESEQVYFALIRQTTTNNGETESRTFVSVEVNEKSKTEVMTASSVAITSSLNWAAGETSYEQIERDNGAITFSKDQLKKIKGFLNRTIKNTYEDPKHNTGWSLTINDRFTIALLYQAKSSNKWKYYFKIDDAEFEAPYEDGLKLLKRLVSFGELAD